MCITLPFIHCLFTFPHLSYFISCELDVMVVLLSFGSWGHVFDNWICLLREREFEGKVVEAIYYMSSADTSENYERLGRIYVWSGIYCDLIVMCVVVSV